MHRVHNTHRGCQVRPTSNVSSMSPAAPRRIHPPLLHSNPNVKDCAQAQVYCQEADTRRERGRRCMEVDRILDYWPGICHASHSLEHFFIYHSIQSPDGSTDTWSYINQLHDICSCLRLEWPRGTARCACVAVYSKHPSQVILLSCRSPVWTAPVAQLCKR